MNNALSMTADFERQKNVKASAITAGVAGLLLLLFFFLKWELPTIPQAPAEELMEVNLGSSDVGSGDDQPMLPGEPAPAEQTTYTPPQPVQAVTSEAKDIETDDRNDNDAPPVVKPAVTKPAATKVDDNNKTVKTTNTTSPQPVVQAPPRPKAVLGKTMGGNGNGGNGADDFKPGTGQGSGNGAGDQGVPGGDPNGRLYSGTPRNFGVKVLNIPAQSFEDDFNQNAKIAVEIVVDVNGKITSASVTPRGSSGTATTSMKNTALRLARQLKMGASDGGQKGIVVFDFKVRG